ncbi:universal stress protein [Bdellovibrio sp. SKB1291214]|uniref:universal stress protein n=1 Tax=Bdellovibrio sp. SKB1291214 TaxID=1732569 RepID=UPI000B51AF1A|nr:universal stress protein [Bdellovibrio sp. SKB1291214]UYL10086.1 universal stress protein [Bdellovibrio sp. SKB1291214]
MPSKYMLIADDVFDVTPGARARSQLVRECGFDLAEKLKSPTKLLYVQNPNDATMKSTDRERIKSTLQQIRQSNKKTQVVEAFGNPVDEIFRMETGSSAPGMVVMGTAGKKGLERFFLGSVAEEVVRNAVVPVMVIGPKVKAAPSAKAKILVATDLTSNSRRAEAYAKKLAKALNAEVVFLHSTIETLRVADQYAAASGTAFMDQTTMDTLNAKSKEALLKKTKLFKSAGVKCTFKMDQHQPTSQAAIAAETATGKYRYLVMGTHGRSAFVKAFLGSTARETIMSSAVPTIVIRSHNK